MAGIAEAMAGMAHGKRAGGLSEHMERPEHKEPEHHDGGEIHGFLKSQHEQHGGKHMHVHQHDDGSHTTHHVGHDGKVEGPHDHENTEELKQHMDRFFDEEEHEPHHEEHDGLM